MQRSLLLLSVILCIAGCGDASQPPPPQTRLFDTQRDALEKAKTVEQTVGTQAERQQEDIARQTGDRGASP